MATWNQLLEQIRTVWQGLSLPGRLLLIGGLAAAVSVLVGVLYWAAQPDYRLLFGDLTPESAAAVTEALQRQGVDYKIGADGTSIYVPADKVHELRLQLAAQGVADGGGKGFELFDESPFGMTPFLEQVNYLRALQAELARTISELEPVTAARVHITRPEPSPFVRDRAEPTASVVLKLAPGATLGPSMVRGITALIAGSVEGLSPENVTVLDATGRVLAGPRDDDTVVPVSLLEYRRNLEEYLARKAEEMLTELLGPGRAVVKVSAEVDLTQQELTREQYDPENKVVRTESITNKKETRSSRTVARGVPGVGSNVPGQGSATTTTPSGLSQEETITSEYLVSKTVSRTLNHAGQLKRLSVAVLVDLPENEEGQPAISIQEVEKVVRNAVGIQEGRGDELTVSEAELASARLRAEMEQELAAAQRWQRYMALARAASLAIASVIALAALWLVVRRFAPPVPATPQADRSAEASGGQPAPVRASHPAIPVLTENIERDPDAVAKVLERWLREEEEAVA